MSSGLQYLGVKWGFWCVLHLTGCTSGSGPWDYQVCTEFLGQELPYFPAGPSSMFWDQGPFDWEAVVQHCQSAWGVTPTKYWSAVEHGGTNWRWEQLAAGKVSAACTCSQQGVRNTLV